LFQWVSYWQKNTKQWNRKLTGDKVGSLNSQQWDPKGEFHFIFLPSTKFTKANNNTVGEVQLNS